MNPIYARIRSIPPRSTYQFDHFTAAVTVSRTRPAGNIIYTSPSPDERRVPHEMSRRGHRTRTGAAPDPAAAMPCAPLVPDDADAGGPFNDETSRGCEPLIKTMCGAHDVARDGAKTSCAPLMSRSSVDSTAGSSCSRRTATPSPCRHSCADRSRRCKACHGAP